MNRNAGLILAARLASALTTVAVLSLVSRSRGAEDLGLVAIGLALGTILATLTDAGATSLIVREGSRRPGELDQLFGALTVARLVLVPAVLAVAWLALTLLLGAPGAIIWLAAAGLPVQQWAELGRSVAQAHGRVAILATHSIVENVAWLGVILVLVLLDAPLEVVLLGGLAVFAVSVAAGLLVLGLSLGIVPRFPTRLLAR